MSADMHAKATERQPTEDAIAVWENEGGAPGSDSMNHLYGRRIEADRTWTVYHVFSGIPAHVGGSAMIGLSRSDATTSMLSLNRRNLERRDGRTSLPSSTSTATAECWS